MDKEFTSGGKVILLVDLQAGFKPVDNTVILMTIDNGLDKIVLLLKFTALDQPKSEPKISKNGKTIHPIKI